MKFETKFSLNDNVWYMFKNKPLEIIISAIEMFHVGTNQDRMKYNARNVTNSTSWLDHTDLFECDLFKSKNDLLKSLFGDDATTCKGKNCSAVCGIGHSNECIEDHDRIYEKINE